MDIKDWIKNSIQNYSHHRNNKIIIWPLLVALLIYGCSLKTRREKDLQIESIGLCELVSDIHKYKGSHVQVAAFIGSSFEQEYLYDPKCRNGEPLVHIQLGANVAGQIKMLRRIIKEDGHAFATVSGIIRGLEPLKLDPELPDWIKDKYEGVTKGYGHNGVFEYEIEIDNVIEAQRKDGATIHTYSDISTIYSIQL